LEKSEKRARLEHDEINEIKEYMKQSAIKESIKS